MKQNLLYLYKIYSKWYSTIAINDIIKFDCIMLFDIIRNLLHNFVVLELQTKNVVYLNAARPLLLYNK